MRFDMDTKKLDQRYKELQWRYHPDKASMRPVEEQEHAADHSTAVNRAYSVLRDPLTRATYMVGFSCVQWMLLWVCRSLSSFICAARLCK